MELKLSTGGIAIIGVSFGFARYGYGLFEPQIREEFALSLGTSGEIASGAYVGYVIALVTVALTIGRVGPRPLVTAAGVLAAAGMALMVIAQHPWQLFIGLVVAGASSGFVWAPYSDAVVQLIPPSRQNAVLAAIPSGTAFGIAIAGGLTVALVTASWREAWIVFSVAAVLATAYNFWILRGTHPLRQPDRPLRERVSTFLKWRQLPLYSTALSYGAVGSVYWTFAVAAVSQASPDVTSAGPLFWTLIGIAGVLAIWSGALFNRLGLERSHTALIGGLAAATVLIAVAPGWWPAVGVSAIIYGPVFMAISGLLAVWSYREFPDRPAAGLNTIVVFLGVGAVIGPAAFGALADVWNLQVALLLAAALAVATLGSRPRVNHAPVAGELST